MFAFDEHRTCVPGCRIVRYMRSPWNCVCPALPFFLEVAVSGWNVGGPQAKDPEMFRCLCTAIVHSTSRQRS